MFELFRIIFYYPFINLLNFFIWLVPGHNVVWGIILLTLVVRFLLLLPSKRAAQAQRKMMELQPLIEELKSEYGDDKQGLAAAQMELFKKNKINPFGSCVPLLIQFPILIVLYHAILDGIHNPSHLYTWLPRPDSIDTTLFGIELTKADPTLILPLIAAVLQYFQMRLTLPKQLKTASGEPNPGVMAQRQMMYVLPAITLFISLRLPAGVPIYWAVTTLFSIIQQKGVNKEKLKLEGVSKVIADAERKHPEHAVKSTPEVKKLLAAEESSTKKGVTVTVRRKGVKK
jgi:YidC/Oxa1 family membrane protein insertase